MSWLKNQFGNYLPVNGKAANASYADTAGTANSVAWGNVSGRPSIPANPNAYVTQTWRNGNAWYRVWSDGFVEQGQTFSARSYSKDSDVWLSFPRAFSSTSWKAMLQPTSAITGECEFTITSKSTNSFAVRCHVFGGGNMSVQLDLYACGY